jgi:hypothetical protein
VSWTPNGPDVETEPKFASFVENVPFIAASEGRQNNSFVEKVFRLKFCIKCLSIKKTKPGWLKIIIFQVGKFIKYLIVKEIPAFNV